jgi:hypothetical protein
MLLRSGHSAGLKCTSVADFGFYIIDHQEGYWRTMIEFYSTYAIRRSARDAHIVLFCEARDVETNSLSLVQVDAIRWGLSGKHQYP